MPSPANSGVGATAGVRLVDPVVLGFPDLVELDGMVTWKNTGRSLIAQRIQSSSAEPWHAASRQLADDRRDPAGHHQQ